MWIAVYIWEYNNKYVHIIFFITHSKVIPTNLFVMEKKK